MKLARQPIALRLIASTKNVLVEAFFVLKPPSAENNLEGGIRKMIISSARNLPSAHQEIDWLTLTGEGQTL
jgi:hypothetical protein